MSRSPARGLAVLLARTVSIVLALALGAVVLPPAPAGAIGAHYSGASTPTWQTNDVVWALAEANGVVYAGGEFTSVQPPGAPTGTGERARTYLTAFGASTGTLLPFDHTL